jgi:hypothetical protein
LIGRSAKRIRPDTKSLEAKADSESSGHQGETGKIEARIGESSERRDSGANVAHGDADRVSNSPRNPCGRQDPNIKPALEQPRGRVGDSEKMMEAKRAAKDTSVFAIWKPKNNCLYQS